MKRKFGDGGDIVEGPNANIGDDTRARAMAWVKRMQENQDTKETPTVKKTTKSKSASASKVPAAYVASANRAADLTTNAPRKTPRISTVGLNPRTLLPDPTSDQPMRKGGKVKKMAKGGGIEQRGKTRGKIC